MKKCLGCYLPVENEKEGEFHSKCSKKFFGVSRPPILDLTPENLKPLARKSVAQRMAITGAQPKFSASVKTIDSKTRLTLVGFMGDFIVKPQHPDFPVMPEVEDLTMHLATAFRISVCQHTLLRSENGDLAYIAKRFDRNNGQKIHQEDFCQLSERLTEDKYKGSYEQAGKLIYKHSIAPGLNAVHYFERILFSFLTGNSDMHLKNFSLRYSDIGVILSPAYDLLNVQLVFPEDKEDLALTLNGKKSNLKQAAFDALAFSLKIPLIARDNVYRKFLQSDSIVAEWVGRSFLPDDWREKYLEIWNQKKAAFLR